MNKTEVEKTNQPIIEYSVTEAALADLRVKYGTVPDASTKEGYEQIKEGLRELVPLRTGIEHRRKELKAESLEWGRRVDSLAKDITGKLLDIETPLQVAKKSIDDAEKNRVAAIEERIKNIIQLSRFNPDSSVENLTAVKSALDRIIVDESFAEFRARAMSLHCEAIEAVSGAIVMRNKRDAEAAELEKLRKEKEQRDQADREERIRKEAAEKATREAEQRAEAQREAEQRARDQQRDKEIREKEEAARKAEAKARDVEHCRQINKAAVNAIVSNTGTATKDAMNIVTAIEKGLIPNVKINY